MFNKKKATQHKESVFKECVLCDALNTTNRDGSGRYYCNAPLCKRRYDLMMWGHAHGYPSLVSFPYAIGPIRELWDAVLICEDAMIEVLLACAQSQDMEVSA